MLAALSNSVRIIAILLGRPGMNVEECITIYTDMIQDIFGAKTLPVHTGIWGKLKSRFDSSALERCIVKILSIRMGNPGTKPIKEGIWKFSSED